MTDRSELIVTRQAPLPEHAPDQPANRDPRFGLAVNLTDLPLAKSCEQLLPQLIPAGELVIEPRPEPLFDTVRRRSLLSRRP